MKALVTLLYNILEEDKVQEDARYKDVEMIDKALQELGYNVRRVGVGKDITELLPKLMDIKPDYIFNLCEEVDNNSWGEIYIAGLLELLKIPYTGSGPFCLALSLNKARAKDVLYSNGIPVPRYQVFDSEEVVLKEELGFPLIIKPLCEDGSFGIDTASVVHNKETLYERLSAKRKECNWPFIVEEYIDGRELNVSILGNGDHVRVLPISELDFSNMPPTSPRICSYSAKWEKQSVEYKGTVPVCPAPLSSALQKKVEDVALKVYSIMGCTDYARVDIRLTEEEVPYIIDVNPNPCVSPDSGFVRSAESSGLYYRDLINEILVGCHQRYHNGKVVNPEVTTQG